MRTQTQPEINDRYAQARNHVEALKSFYYSVLAYCFVIPFLIFINYKTYWHFQWFWFPMFGWGLGLIIQAFKVFVNNSIFGSEWEQRKMEDFMRDEEKKRWN